MRSRVASMADKRSIGPPQNKACEACRLLKIRCLGGIPGPGPDCQRCLRLGIKCVYVKPLRRTQRKRTEARIHELEQEMEAMRALLGQHVRAMEGSTMMHTPPSTESPVTSVVGASASSQEMSWQRRADPHAPKQPDVVDRGILRMELAEELFETFKSKCNSKFPALNLRPDYTVTALRQRHRVLFLAVMAAAAGMAHPDLYSVLNTEAIQEYANASLVRGEKTLELVQAMSTTVLWYYPVGSWSQAKFYEYIHYASAMATDLGLGEDGIVSKETSGLLGVTEPSESLEGASSINSAIEIENFRAWLLCYLNCTSVSLVTRRQNMLPFDERMARCITKLEASPLRFRSDAHLLAMVKMAHIAERINSAYSLADSTTTLTLSSERNMQIRTFFQPRITSWRRAYEQLEFNISTEMLFHYVKILLFEPCIHPFYPSTAFKPPFLMQPPIVAREAQPDDDWLQGCILSSHAMCDMFLALDLDDLRSLPIKLQARILYVLLLLVRIALIDNVYLTSKPGTSYRSISKVDFYLASCIDLLVKATGMTEYRAPFFIAGMTLRLSKWYTYQLRVKKTSESPEDPPYTLGAGPETHPALQTAPQVMPASPLEMVAQSEEDAEHEVLGEYGYHNPEPGLDIDVREANYMPNLDGVQTYDDFELNIEAEFLAMTQHVGGAPSRMG